MHLQTHQQETKKKNCAFPKEIERKDVKDKSPGATVKNGTTYNQSILKPTEINFVNSGKRKMINDCDHKCPKAVGFSYPGVVLHCSERELEKKKRKYDVKQEFIDEVSCVEAIKEVERKLWLTHYDN